MTADVPTLVSPEWLEPRLDEPDLQVLDCTVYLSSGDDGTYILESGYEDWKDGHVPGSGFADLIEDLSESEDPAYPFELPDPETFAREVEALGVGDDTRVVIYDAIDAEKHNEWAARLWWMFRVFGHDEVGVLNGGWQRWTAEDRPTSAAASDPEPATFTPDYRPELVADKSDVREHIGDDEACLINALRPVSHAGGRIPDSVNVPAIGDEAVIDPETGTYLPEAELRERFDEVDATAVDDVVTYCGAGIAASSAALALYVAGVEDAAVYDGSLSEWEADPSLPLVRD